MEGDIKYPKWDGRYNFILSFRLPHLWMLFLGARPTFRRQAHSFLIDQLLATYIHWNKNKLKAARQIPEVSLLAYCVLTNGNRDNPRLLVFSPTKTGKTSDISRRVFKINERFCKGQMPSGRLSE